MTTLAGKHCLIRPAIYIPDDSACRQALSESARYSTFMNLAGGSVRLAEFIAGMLVRAVIPVDRS